MHALLIVLLFAGPEDAVVRITSHGASGTVIFTTQGRTLVLTVAHAFGPDAVRRAITIDAPAPSPGATRTGGIRLIKLDRATDLALVEMRTGPLPYVCAVATSGTRASRCASVGYDEMKARVVRPAQVIGSRPNETLTRERPWHGRSGGALIDEATGRLVGVCSAYSGPRDRKEISPGNHGVYVSLSAVLTFLGGPR